MKHPIFQAVAAFLVGSIPAMAQPNVLLLIADDMGLDASACYSVGEQQAPMPTIETLCNSGLVFENAYTAPTCSPTRAAILTGQYGFRTGVGAPVAPSGANELSINTPSLFDAVNSVGYAANLIGKWHLSGRQSGYDAPRQMGISHFYGTLSGGLKDYHNWTAIDDGSEVHIEGYSTSVLTNRAIDWIAGQNQPWFLWLAYNAPHAPFHLPPMKLHGSDHLRDDQTAIDDDPLPYYQAMLEAMDTEIGRLIASMPEIERENTIIMFMGDNGSPNQVTRGLYGDHGAKGSLYDSGTRVPFVVAGPGIRAGRTFEFVSSTDFYATISGIAGAETAAPDSIDFGPILEGRKGNRDFIYVEHFSDRPVKGKGAYGWALRQNQYKSVNPVGQAPELYDLNNDPLEQYNLLTGAESEIIREIANQLQLKRNHLITIEN